MLTEIIALAALFLSGISIYKTLQFQKNQSRVNDVQEQLNTRLLLRENKNTFNEKKANVLANCYNNGKSHRLKIYNSGMSEARNIRIKILSGIDNFIEDDIKSKFPVEILHQHHNVELILLVSKLTSSNNIKVELVWDDDSGYNNKSISTPKF